MHCVPFSKISNAINNKRRQQQKRDSSGNIKKPVKGRTSLSAKRAQNDHEPVEESYKDVSGTDCDQYKSNDNYRTDCERRKSTASQEDGSRMEKRMIEAKVNDDRIDCDRIESRNSNDDDNDKRFEKESVEHKRQSD